MNGRDGFTKSSLDLMWLSPRVTRIRLEFVDAALQEFVDQLAVGAGIKGYRLIVIVEQSPSQGVPPHESQGIAEHQAQRRRGLDLLDGADDDGMSAADTSIMRSDARLQTTAPAARCLLEMGHPDRLCGPGEQPVSLAYSVLGNPRAR
jgi:hypothetical protein